MAHSCWICVAQVKKNLCRARIDMMYYLKVFHSFPWRFREKSVTLSSEILNVKIIGDKNMMLGMNAPKPVARGEYAKAIRKAVHDSIEAIKNGKVPEPKNLKCHFEWKDSFDGQCI